MYNKLEPINKITDKEVSIKEIMDYSFAKEQMNSPITISEFYEACKDYPIFFVKDASNLWMATVMLGYKEKKILLLMKKVLGLNINIFQLILEDTLLSLLQMINHHN